MKILNNSIARVALNIQLKLSVGSIVNFNYLLIRSLDL